VEPASRRSVAYPGNELAISLLFSRASLRGMRHLEGCFKPRTISFLRWSDGRVGWPDASHRSLRLSVRLRWRGVASSCSLWFGRARQVPITSHLFGVAPRPSHKDRCCPRRGCRRHLRNSRIWTHELPGEWEEGYLCLRLFRLASTAVVSPPIASAARSG
jgi:hypothetical protein